MTIKTKLSVSKALKTLLTCISAMILMTSNLHAQIDNNNGKIYSQLQDLCTQSEKVPRFIELNLKSEDRCETPYRYQNTASLSESLEQHLSFNEIEQLYKTIGRVDALGMCYFFCNSDQECNAVKGGVVSEPTNISYSDYLIFKYFPEKSTQNYSNEQGPEKSLVTYGVIRPTQDTSHVLIIPPVFGKTKSLLESLFGVFDAFYIADKHPSHEGTHVGEFAVSCTEGDTLGYIAPVIDEQDFSWELQFIINLRQKNNFPKDVDHLWILGTLAHEYAHIISFNKNSLIPTSSCKEDSGLYHDRFNYCISSRGYLGAFTKQFWPHYKKTDLSGKNLYEQNPLAFVSEYAATEAAEDFAESFKYFILSSPELMTTEQKMMPYYKKIRFFYSYPELVTRRASFRDHAATFIRNYRQ